MKKFYTLSLLALTIQFTFATTRNVPGTYATIQAGLNACAAGDTVLVQPGTYTQNVTWPNVNGVKLFAAGDTSNTTISGGGVGITLSINSVLADTNSIVRGFKITGGFYNSTFGYGGGISISQGGIKLRNCLVANNTPGGNLTSYAYAGGAYVGGNNSVFEGCTFRNNIGTSTGYAFGGAIYLNTNTTLRIRNSVIKSNGIVATNYCFGGGIYSHGNLIMSNSQVDNNSTTSGGYNFGGGIEQEGGTATLTNVKITNNTVGGAANYFWGAGFYTTSAGNTTMTNVLIAGNIMGNGGFVYAGGGIYADGSNTLITGTNITVTDNHRANSGTISGSGMDVESSATVVLKNSILYNTNGGVEVNNSSSTITITYSDVRGGFTGTGNINAIPLFVSTTDFHLTNLSPCVATATLTGSPNNDLDNATRPMPALTNPDMGCYELNQPPVSVEDLDPSLLSFQTYPNPFTTATEIHFSLRKTQNVKLEVFDVNGRFIQGLLHREYSKGDYIVKFDRTDLNAGMYFCRLTVGNEIRVVKMIKQ